MKESLIPIARLLLALTALLCLTACPPMPPGGYYPSDTDLIGTISETDGGGAVRINDRPVGVGAKMYSGDHISTDPGAWAALRLARGGRILFDDHTDPVLEWLSTAFCKLRILINVGSILVETDCETVAETGSGAVIETLNTTFHLYVDANVTVLTVLEGRMSIRGDVGGRQTVPAGWQCRVYRNRAAPPPVRVDEGAVIRWACRLDPYLCGGSTHRPPRPPRPSRDTSVPKLIGGTVAHARRMLERSDLEVGRIRERQTDRRQDDDRVIDQSPAPGSRVSAGTAVDLSVGRYRPESNGVAMPNLLNLPAGEASQRLRQAGIRLGRMEEITTPDPDLDGRVARQSPRAGTPVHRGMTATLTRYRYERQQPRLVKTPQLEGLHIGRAKAVLGQHDLRLGRTITVPDRSANRAGIIFRQNPEAGLELKPGSSVMVWVYGSADPNPAAPGGLRRIPIDQMRRVE